MRILIDANTSKKYVWIFDECFKLDAVHITKHFPQGTKDLDWIPNVARWNPKPMIFGTDINISRKKLERTAIKENYLEYVLCTGRFSELPFQEQCWRLIKFWPEIQREIIRNPGCIYLVDIHNERITID